jgi:asparagine synthase (glutamine-hydrolysing)
VRGIEELIEGAVRKGVEGLETVPVAFSGGLDSSLVALLASKFVKVECVVAGVKGKGDFSSAEEAARLLNLPLRKIEFEVDETLVEEVSQTIGSTDSVQVSLAIPLYCLCGKLDRKVLLLGQGADELFLGYEKYYSGRGDWKMDLAALISGNCERDRKAAGRWGVRIITPFLDEELVAAISAIPESERLSDPVLRKAVLRRAAINLGLPEKLALAPKKAMQYSTGALRAVELLKKNKNRDIGEGEK